MRKLNPSIACLVLAVACGCSSESDGGASGAGGASGCTRAPDCSACATCAASCFCQTQNALECDLACRPPGAGGAGAVAGVGATAGVGFGGAAASSAGGSGGDAATSGAGGAGGSGGDGASGTAGVGGNAGAGTSGTSGTSGVGGTGAVSSGDCLTDLGLLGITFTTTSARGVVDAVEIGGPINGVLFANAGSTTPSSDPMACEFVKTLHTFAGLLAERGIVRLGTLGSYCYRCCCAWSMSNFCRGPSDPEPDCSANGYSNHSWGRAIDVRYLYTAAGDEYDINSNSDWEEWPTSSETCEAALGAQTGTSLFLYSLVCEQRNRAIFGSVLTPNYNSAHRNHWHMDIGQSGTPSNNVVRSERSGIDIGEGGDE